VSKYTPFHMLPGHIREALIKDPMHLQREHDAEVAAFRLTTGADIWTPKEPKA